MPEVQNGDVRLHYEMSGTSAGRALMFSNSLGSNLHMWDKVVPRLEASHHILRYDMRGHGKSSVPDGPYTIGQLGGDVLFLLDQLGIERVDLCGLSVGGMIAMWIAIHAPERLGRLILANTAARIGTREGWEQRIATVETAGMASLATASMERWFTRPYREEHPDEMEAMRVMIAAIDAKGYEAGCALLRDTDLRGEIGSISAPALVISGKHDPVTPPSDGLALHAALKGSKYVELNAAHISAWERADEFAEAVESFLSEEECTNG
jgi:3-oxoadipate enol-lactonase